VNFSRVATFFGFDFFSDNKHQIRPTYIERCLVIYEIVKILLCIYNEIMICWALVAATSNSSELGHCDQKDHAVRPAKANPFQDPIYKTTRAKME
jgi:hypothetical protein